MIPLDKNFVEAVKAMEQAIAGIRDLIQNVRTEQVEAEGKLNLLNERVESLLVSVKSNGDGLESRTRKLESSVAELKSLQTDVERLSEDIRSNSGKIEALKTEYTVLSGAFKALEATETALSQDNRDRTSKTQTMVGWIGALIAVLSLGVAIWAVMHGAS